MCTLTKQHFINFLENAVGEFIKKEYPTATLRRDVFQRNNYSYQALAVSFDNNVAMSFNLDALYEDHQSDLAMEEILKRCENTIRTDANRINLSGLIEEAIKKGGECLIKVVVPFEGNDEYLKGLLYERYLDLAIIFKYNIDEIGTFAITKALADNLNMSFQDFSDLAKESPYSDYRIGSMSDFYPEMGGLFECPFDVIANKEMYFSSGALTDMEFLKKVGERFDSSFYIVPSSIHELLVVKSDKGNMEEISNMVKEVNEDVEPEDVLADHAYFYDYETGEIMF